MDDFLEGSEKIRRYYAKLSNHQLVFKHIKTTYLMLFSIPLLVLGIFLSTLSSSPFEGVGALLILVYPLLTLLFERSSRRYTQRNFQPQIIVRTKQQMEGVLRRHRKEEMKRTLKNSGYDNSEKVKLVIENLSYSHDKTTFERLLPFSIMILLLLPIWSEYVGFRFSALLSYDEKTANLKSLSLVWQLTLIAVILTIFIYMVVTIFRLFILFRINQEQSLCRVLRNIAHDMKLEEGLKKTLEPTNEYCSI